MKLRFEKDTLAYATNIAQSVANPQSSLPILGNILITARPDGIAFEASDMESCVRCVIQGEVVEPGAMTVPAKTFHSIVRELPDGPVDLEFGDSLAVITSGDNQYKLATQIAEDFPTWPDLQAGTTISLEQATLKRILDHVMFAIPLREPRKALLGANFDIKNNQLIVVGTDAKKLGLSKCDLAEVTGAQPTSAIIPRKILEGVRGNLADEGTARLLIGERQIAFELGNVVYLSNRIEAVYVSYETHIPKDFSREIRLNRLAFYNAVRRASIISEERNNSIIMRFEQGRVNFSSRTYEVGSYQGSLEVGYDGDPFDIAFNHIYLTEVFKVVDTEELVMKVKQNRQAVVFTAPEYQDSLFLVMPIRLTDIAEFEG